MSVSAFKFGTRMGASIKLPLDRAERTEWHPQIHDLFPDFTAPTTQGTLTLSDWAAGSWVFLVTHPAAFTPVCTSEITELARRLPEFTERHVKVIALTCDPVDRIRQWTSEIERMNDITVSFAHVADPEGVIARSCGLMSHEPIAQGQFCARKTFVLDPERRIRMICDYPVAVGRSVDEALRTIDALMLSDRLGVFTPSDWELGDPMLLNHTVSLQALHRRFGAHVRGEASYYRKVDFNAATGSARPARREAAPADDTGPLPEVEREQAIRLARLINWNDA